VVGFDVYEAISKCSDLLLQFGGHMYAAGLTLKVDQIPAFRERFEKVVSSSISSDHLIPQIEVDLEIELSEIDYKLYNILKQIAPFGPGNMQPVFVSRKVKTHGLPRLLKDQHLKFTLTQDGTSFIDAIGFGMAKHFSTVTEKSEFDICYNICENDFNGKKSLQLLVKDIK
jgi:single-stranded-DNA-specific exonuclease